MLPREFGRLERRSLVSREALVATGAVAIAIVVVTGIFGKDDPAFLASAYSFGVLFAFTAAQLAVIRLRRTEPDLERPVQSEAGGANPRRPRAAAGADRRAADVRDLGARADHAPGRPLRRPAWLLLGLVVYVVVRRRREVGRPRRRRSGRGAAARRRRSRRCSCR